MAIKKLITIDDHVIKLLDEILSKKKFISSENMDIAISIISIKDCKKATLMAAKALINELNPTKNQSPQIQKLLIFIKNTHIYASF